jgi:hypothetical protein
MDPIQIGSHLFTPEALQQAIQQTETLSAGKKGALIGSVDTQGAHVALVVRVSDHVEFQTALKWSDGQVSGGAKVIASW